MNWDPVRLYGWPALVVLGFTLLGLLVQRAVVPRLLRLARRSAWRLDDLLVDAIRWPLVLWFLLAGVRTALRLLPLDRATDALLAVAVLVAAILSVTWAAARFAYGAVRETSLPGGAQSVSLLASIASGTVVVGGVLVALQTLGIRITPLITALGIGGLAVGLALQDTLSNIFAGLRILSSKKIRPGDFVRLESGQDGWVTDIAWGQTTIRQGLGNIVVVPNAKLAQAVTLNYSLPAPEQLFVVTLTVAHGSDLAAVESLARDAARAAMRGRPEGSPDFEPVVLFQPFTEAGIPFITVIKARAFFDIGGVQSDFLKALHRAFTERGIAFGVPERRVRTAPDAT